MVNPFTIGIVTESDFCNRSTEKQKLTAHIINGQNVVLYAKRLMGKSSLVKEVLRDIPEANILTAYANIFSVSSEKDFITKLASAIATGIDQRAADKRSWAEKFKDLFSRVRIGLEATPQGMEFTAGFDKNVAFNLLLEDLMDGLYKYVKQHKLRAVIAIDEFQEITEIPETKQIEGTLRQYMQERRDVTYIYVGSRRRVLLEMFTDKKRPFYKSAFAMTIGEIPRSEFAPYISERFARSGKKCPEEAAEALYDAVKGYSYYVQKLASICWDITKTKCSEDTVKTAYSALIKMEAQGDFEGTYGGLPLGQKAVLKAIAKEPTSSLFSKEYLSSHSLSQGSVQRALEALIKRDLIEKVEGVYKTSDPVMADWLTIAG